MTRVNNKSINLSIKILTIFAFALLVMPIQARAEGGQNSSFGGQSSFREAPKKPAQPDNPKPTIYFITPDSGDRSLNEKSITITGKGFTSSSVARINGTSRSTAFIDPAHLMLRASGADMYQTDGGFYITVFNEGPGGGFSNSELFELNNAAAPGVTQNAYPYPNDPNNSYNANPPGNEPVSEAFSNLTATAVYGSGSFLPSGIVQWVLFAIIILLMVILARKFFGGEQNYQAAPLKHD